MYVKIRPHLYAFLDHVAQSYELIVYCSGSRLLCEPVLNLFEKEKHYFAHRVYGEHKLAETAGNAVKFYDFLLTGVRSGVNTVIVDSSVSTFATAAYCGVPVAPFLGDSGDDLELIKLGRYLDVLLQCKSVIDEVQRVVCSGNIAE